jgi:sulfide:quinone oxidoreductase
MAGQDTFKVVIAGGGAAGVEALLWLHAELGLDADLELIAPAEDYVHRALAVLEPFGRGEVRTVPLEKIAADCHARHRRDSLAGVDPERRVARTAAGEEVAYDALLIALGAAAVEALPGALTYRGAPDTDAIRDLLERLRDGKSRRVSFAIPATVRWALPLYELALLTAGALAAADGARPELTLVTPEVAPLEAFGRRASDSVREALAEAGVELVTESAPSAIRDGELRLAGGDAIEADEVVALPKLSVAEIPGIPQGPHGFIGTDRYMRVEGVSRVYAAGDATWFPIKQGGLAAQQADAAAASIVSLSRGESPSAPFRPVLRAALMTATTPRYLRSEVGERQGSSAASNAPLWWPPAKVAGRLLAPYLREGGEPEGPAELEDVEALEGEAGSETEQDHRDAVELALAAADADARWRDYRGALRWLALAEDLDLSLTEEYAAKRRDWEAELTDGEPV